MADKHPYVTSPGPLIQVIDHLRNSFPSPLNAETLKKLGFAPKNESYIINALRFLDLIDDEGNKTKEAAEAFSLHQDDAFQKKFASIVKKAYNELFSLHSEKAWTLEIDALITFFRQTDQSSGIVGKRQANTFLALSKVSGHEEVPEIKTYKKKGVEKSSKKNSLETTEKSRKLDQNKSTIIDTTLRDFALTVRIEINLPADGNQDTYDRIFKSIKENLLNG